MLSTVLEFLANSRDELLRLQTDLVAIPALGPTNAGQGEKAKVEYLAEYAGRFAGVRTEMIKAPDDRVECGYRPSLTSPKRSSVPVCSTVTAPWKRPALGRTSL